MIVFLLQIYPPVKPDLNTAMDQLIQQVRTVMPFDLPMAQLCDGVCRGCAKKLLAFLEMELEEWEDRLADGDIPNFGDINRLARRSKKIHAALKRNNLV